MFEVTPEPHAPRLRRHRLFDLEVDAAHLRSSISSLPHTGEIRMSVSGATTLEREPDIDVGATAAAPDRPLVVSDHEDSAQRLDELGGLGYRIVYRLLGDRHTATALTGEVLRNVAGLHPRPGTVAGADEVTIAWGSVETALRYRETARQWITAEPTFANHRLRLCRELRRWDDASRLILTLRHLAGFDVAVVARLLRVDEVDSGGLGETLPHRGPRHLGRSPAGRARHAALVARHPPTPRRPLPPTRFRAARLQLDRALLTRRGVSP
jgi:hypothetical protein